MTVAPRMTAQLSGQAPGFPSTKNGEWPYYTADVKGSRYSPLDPINGMLRSTVAGEVADRRELALEAVNRKGRLIEVRATASPLDRGGGQVAGAILVMALVSG